MKRVITICSIAAVILTANDLVQAATLKVPSAKYPTIQTAIDAAFNGDEVVVADGTYTGTGNRDIDFLGKAITVQSKYGPENCIIDCQGSTEDEHRGFYFHSGETLSSVIDGFTIKNGYGPVEPFSGSFFSVGGGIYCTNSSPTITNNIITGNTAEYGGGIQCCEYSSPRVTNNVITRNSSSQGAGIWCYKFCSATISNNTITENVAGWSGGGVKIDMCSSAEIVNNVIAENSAQWKGGGIYCGNSSPMIINNTIAYNSSQNEGGGTYFWHAFPIIVNTILWGDSPEEIVLGAGGSITITHSCVQGGWPGAGNIDVDPLFVDAANAYYHLLLDSPCIDAGDNTAVTSGTDLDGNPRIVNDIVDMGAFEAPLQDPVQLLEILAQQVIDLDLQSGIEISLLAKLDAAQKANDSVAINLLQAFINAVESQRGSKITENDAVALIAAAQQIIDLLMAD